MIDVEQYLQSHHIAFTLHEHPPVFTVAEAEEHCATIPGMACKNLVLRDNKNTRLLLLVAPAKKRIDVKTFAKKVNVQKLSFAKAETLKEKLGLDPGSVSPFGVLNDTQHEIELYIDEDVYDADIVTFHPNRNTATLELTQEMFRKFLEGIDTNVTIVDLAETNK